MADESLRTIQKETKGSKLFRLTESSYLYVQGEVYYGGENIANALRTLRRSLKIMEEILQSHTSTSRCLNAIGNCHKKLGEHDEAIQYYTRAYEMRKELSSGMNHFDMPFYKGQIGTVYEVRKEYHKAIECYKEALELAKELKIPGMFNTALFNRNIANAYVWQGEFEEAYQPAKNAYEIRRDILGNHPWTARSAFQMAEICRCLMYDEAEEYYTEAWKIEKSLGQGNHSKLMVRIVQRYEAILTGMTKKEFQKKWLELNLRYWGEDLSDRQTQKKYQREALWFYQETWKRNKAEMKRQDRIDILTILKNYASSFKDETTDQVSANLLKVSTRAFFFSYSIRNPRIWLDTVFYVTIRL